MDRRTWLRVGGLSLGALCAGASPNLAELLAAAERTSADRDFSVILFWANGGPSHLETFDLKPNAPEEVRGLFRPIKTNVSGMEICELFPRLAKMADKFAILRNLHHERAEHSGGTHRFLSGHASIAANLQNGEYPELGSVVAKQLDRGRREVPFFVADTQFYGAGPAYLGKAYAPFMCNPNNPVSASGNNTYDPIPIYPTEGGTGTPLAADATLRLTDRADLLQQIDRFRREANQSGVLDSWDRQHRKAVEILSSSKTSEAFNLAKESESVRRRYGDTFWGKSLLTCRRLIEAGARFVQCQATYQLPPSIGRTTNWDDHSVNADIFEAYKLKLPVLDHVISALIEDLHVRGLDKRVLFIFCGEFGRTPTIRNQDVSKRPGRDHWPRAMSVFLAGGGLRMGQVIGATNARGEYPVEKPMDSNCLLATIYHRFGIDYTGMLHDKSNRPIHILPKGEPIRELL